MKRTPALAVALLLATALSAQAEKKMEGTGHTDYFGHKNCIVLENADTRVVLTGEGGGRVLEYAFKGKNSMYLSPTQKGWTWDKSQEPPWEGPTGGRTDIGPETTIPAHPELWLGDWQAEITGPRQARLTSVEDGPTGVQLIREFRLAETGSHLSCTQIMRNVSDEHKSWGHWSRTFAPGGGIVVIPLSKTSRFPQHYIRYGPGPVMNFQPNDANIRQRDGYLEVLGTPEQAKLGMDSMEGWFAYLMHHDQMFVKRYRTYPDRVYGEMAALTISIWYYKNEMCELEPIGPLEDLDPGEAAAFVEDWYLLEWDYPAEGEDVDLQALTAKVEAETR
jgi:hypothetical protein